MAYISEIVKAIEKKYNSKVYGNFQKRHSVDGIHFFNANDANIGHLSPNILYIADYTDFGKAIIYGDVLFVGTGGETPPSDSIYIEDKIDLIDYKK